jgi:hypothetical protein
MAIEYNILYIYIDMDVLIVMVTVIDIVVYTYSYVVVRVTGEDLRFDPKYIRSIILQLYCIEKMTHQIPLADHF